MEVLREKNGRHLQGILETGKKIAKKVLGFSFMRMETSMKACGALTNDMAKERTGAMKLVS